MTDPRAEFDLPTALRASVARFLRMGRYVPHQLATKAADEIERLQKELDDAKASNVGASPQ